MRGEKENQQALRSAGCGEGHVRTMMDDERRGCSWEDMIANTYVSLPFSNHVRSVIHLISNPHSTDLYFTAVT